MLRGLHRPFSEIVHHNQNVLFPKSVSGNALTMTMANLSNKLLTLYFYIDAFRLPISSFLALQTLHSLIYSLQFILSYLGLFSGNYVELLINLAETAGLSQSDHIELLRFAIFHSGIKG